MHASGIRVQHAAAIFQDADLVGPGQTRGGTDSDPSCDLASFTTVWTDGTSRYDGRAKAEMGLVAPGSGEPVRGDW